MSVSLTFDSNGGTGTMTTQTETTPTAITLNTFINKSFTFNGWNTRQNGLGTSYLDEAIFPFEADTTLYAQWGMPLIASSLQFPFANEDEFAFIYPELLKDNMANILSISSELIASYIAAAFKLTNPLMISALRDATIHQTAQWLTIGDTNDLAGYREKASIDLGNLKTGNPSILSPRAKRIMKNAGLLEARAIDTSLPLPADYYIPSLTLINYSNGVTWY